MIRSVATGAACLAAVAASAAHAAPVTLTLERASIVNGTIYGTGFDEITPDEIVVSFDTDEITETGGGYTLPAALTSLFIGSGSANLLGPLTVGGDTAQATGFTAGVSFDRGDLFYNIFDTGTATFELVAAGPILTLADLRAAFENPAGATLVAAFDVGLFDNSDECQSGGFCRSDNGVVIFTYALGDADVVPLPGGAVLFGTAIAAVGLRRRLRHR